MAEPTSLTGFELPLALQKSHDGEQFLLHDSSPQDENRVIVFATLPGLDLLSLSDDWFCDGTFSTAPNVFCQIYTIHASVEGCLIPIVYALLPDKKESTYSRLLSILKVDSPKRVTIDFEVAVRNSIIATHQSAQIQFRFFHMSQSVWRHVQSSGNTHNYNNDFNFRELIRMLLATAFLCAGQKVARPKKAKYQKLDKNLITLIKSYQPNDIIGFLKGCSYNIKL